MRYTVLLITAVVLLVSGCSNTNENTNMSVSVLDETKVESVVSNVQETEVQLPEPELEEDIYYDDGLAEFEFKTTMETDVVFNDTLPGDETGLYRYAIINTDKDILKFAPDYYYAYFKSDAEIHFVINNGLWTVTKIERYGDSLFLNIREFDIHDGYNVLDFNRGELLGDFVIDLNTGKTSELVNGEIIDYEW